MNHFMKRSLAPLVHRIVLLIFVFGLTGVVYAASTENGEETKVSANMGSTKTEQVINTNKSSVRKPASAMQMQKEKVINKVPLPDLMVTNVEMSQNCRLKYTLKNNSKMRIRDRVHAKGKLKIRISGKPAKTLTLPFTRIDRKGILKRPFGTLTATTTIEINGTSFVTLTIDPENQIPESNENNNVSRRTRLVNNCKNEKKSLPAMSVRGKSPEPASSRKPVVPMISKNNNRAQMAVSRSASVEATRRVTGEDTEPDIYRDQGIDITLPGTGAVFNPGEIINVQYSVSGELPGVIGFRLMIDGEIVDRKTRSYTPPATGTAPTETEQFNWRVPFSASSGTDYYIYAELYVELSEDRSPVTPVFGFGHNFEIQGRHTAASVAAEAGLPELPIDILAPVGNDTVVLGETTQIQWTMPESDSEVDCGDRVRVFAVQEGRDNQILLESRWYQPGDNSFAWFVNPDTFHMGRYQIYIETSGECRIRGAAFEITGCDYAVESVTFLDGRSLSAGIDAGSGSTISGGFRVKIRWNGIPLPSSFAPGTAWGNLMTVRSTITGDRINVPAAGVNFDYTDVSVTSGGVSLRDVIYLDVPFEFDRDQIADMVTGTRNIPLRFSFVTTGASRDYNEANNTLIVQMKVLALNIVDFQIRASGSSFSLTRDVHWPGSAPVYDYHFIQNGIDVRNAALTASGATPADISNVPVKWYIEWRPDGGSWSEAPISHGSSTFPVVSGGWDYTYSISRDYSTIIDDPGRTYRLRLVVDPDHEFLDSNRHNNTAVVILGNPGG